MSELETTISKIRLPDGTVVNLSNNQKLVIPQLAICNVTWNINSFTGKTSLIDDSDYLLTIPDSGHEYHNLIDDFDKDTQTKNGSTLTWDSTEKAYLIDHEPTAYSPFYLYVNESGFPNGLNPGDDVIFGCRSGNQYFTLYAAYTKNGTNWTNLGNSYSETELAIYKLPADAVGFRVYLYARIGSTYSNVYAYPTVLIPNS